MVFKIGKYCATMTLHHFRYELWRVGVAARAVLSSVCPSFVRCLRFSRNMKAVQTSKCCGLKTALDKSNYMRANLRSKDQRSRSMGTNISAIVFGHIFVKIGSIFVTPRPKIITGQPQYYTKNLSEEAKAYGESNGHVPGHVWWRRDVTLRSRSWLMTSIHLGPNVSKRAGDAM